MLSVELPWQVFAVVATVAYGIMNFIYKVAAERGCSSFYVMASSGATVSLLAGAATLATGFDCTHLALLVGMAAANSLFFALGSVAKIEALRFIPAGTAFPLVKFNSVLAVLIAILFLGERPTLLQYGGIALGMGVVLLLAWESRTGRAGSWRGGGVALALGAAAATAVSMTVGKLASSRVDHLGYIFVSYSLLAVYTILSGRRHGRAAAATRQRPLNRATVGFGALIGSLNLLGYYLILRGFEVGPMSGVQPIFAMSVVVPILLSLVFYGERLNALRLLALAGSVASVVLISWR